MSITIKPFKIQVPDAEIADLRQRLRNARWPMEPKNSGWTYGTDLQYLRSLVTYWHDKFDWRTQEKKLNSFPQFITEIDGHTIHFIHVKGKGKRSTPVVLLHGWPSSFLQMLDLIPLLTTADESGHSFDVIVPSLVGYTFSKHSGEPGMNVYKMAILFNRLTTDGLGYPKVLLRGSDLGAGVAKEWALAFPGNVTGLHLSGSNPYIFQLPETLSDAEKAFVQRSQQFMMNEGAYASLQSTKPQTAAFALDDSPVGLAAWIVEKFRNWSDNDGNVEKAFSRDDLLTNLSLYWFTRTIGTSMWLYYESAHVWSPNANKQVSVPVAFLMMAKDIAVGPREWEARTYSNIIRWNLLPGGGHFAEWEQPAAVAADIIAFYKMLEK